MKKKILLSTLLILMFSLPLMAFTMEIAPYEGAFGVPLGSDAYDGGSEGWSDSASPDDTEGRYSDSEIVAIAEFQNISASDVASANGKEVRITVSCPNGMFFVSQSNPAFKFPFELQLIWTDQSTYNNWERYTRTAQRTRTRYGYAWGNWGDWSNWTTSDEEWEKYKDSGNAIWDSDSDDVDWVRDDSSQAPGQQKNWYISKNSNVSEQDPESFLQFRISDTNDGKVFQEQKEEDYTETNFWGTEQTQTQKIIQVGYVYDRFQEMDLWADIVLVLPGTVNTANDSVTYNNVVYPLIEADDYTALVTITMEYGGQIKSITIPFSGFYEKGNTLKDTSVCSLLVNPYSTAAHLSITEDRGAWVPVGSLDFMLSTASNNSPDAKVKITEPRIFASSSSDPEAGVADDFRLVHESATFNTPLTQTNSIGFDVRIRNLNAAGGTLSCVFDGTATQQDIVNGNKAAIEPAYIKASLNHDGTDKSYYLYNGEIEVMMDPGTNVMLEGRYTGTVYIHVIADETGV